MNNDSLSLGIRMQFKGKERERSVEDMRLQNLIGYIIY